MYASPRPTICLWLSECTLGCGTGLYGSTSTFIIPINLVVPTHRHLFVLLRPSFMANLSFGLGSTMSTSLRRSG